MKVAMVTPYWFPVRGGLTTFVSELSQELRRNYGMDVHVLAKEGAAPGAKVIGGDAAEFIRLTVQELSRIQPAVVHAHGHWYTLRAAIRHKSRYPKTKVVFTVHTELLPTSRSRSLLLGRLLSQADLLTAVSTDLLARTLRSFRPRTRTRVIRPGVTIRRSSATDVAVFLKHHGLEGRRPLIAFVGPLAYELKARGLAHLVRAMRKIRTKYPAATLVIAGDGPLRERLEIIASREIPDGARFLGMVDEPMTVFGAADLVAHISFQEGLPLAVLEAMASGKPIVAASIGGIPEVIRDDENGLLVLGDPEEIADKVLLLLGSTELANRLADNALADAKSVHAWRNPAARFFQVYGGRTPHRVVVTVDLEKDFGSPPGSFRGIDEALPKILDLFKQHHILGHFFATSDLCTSYPEKLRELVKRGHSLGCHGETHEVPYLSSKSPQWQRASITRATEEIEDCTGVRPIGFRAPNFSADGATVRALEGLGYRYDSSVLPGRVVKEKRVLKRTDFLAAPREPYRPSRDDPGFPGEASLVEFPVAENPNALGGPIGLGFVHARGVDQALEAVASAWSDPCVILIHPWELIEPPPRGAPRWMYSACTPETSKLDEFLSKLQSEHEMSTFARELDLVSPKVGREPLDVDTLNTV